MASPLLSSPPRPRPRPGVPGDATRQRPLRHADSCHCRNGRAPSPLLPSSRSRSRDNGFSLRLISREILKHAADNELIESDEENLFSKVRGARVPQIYDSQRLIHSFLSHAAPLEFIIPPVFSTRGFPAQNRNYRGLINQHELLPISQRARARTCIVHMFDKYDI